MAEEIRTLPSGVQYKVIDGVYGGLVGNEADIASMTNAYNQPENLVSALGEATETDTDTFTYSGDKTGKTVTFDDGSVLTQKGYSFKYEDADGNPLELDTAGLKASSDSKNDALSTVVGGIKRDLTEGVYEDFGGQESALVSEYLADQQAIADQRARTDERQDEAMFGTIDGDPNSDTYLQRTGGTMQDLNDQVKKEAAALGISTDEYYALPPSMRLGMGLTDIGELFGESNTMDYGDYGGYEDIEAPTNVSSGLGTLSSENAAEYGKAAKDYLSKNYAPNYSPSLDTMDAMYYEGYPPYDPAMDAMYMGETTGPKDEFFSGFNDYSILGVPIGPGGPSGPGAGSNTGSGGSNVGGGGDDNSGQPDNDFNDIGGGIGVGVPVIGPVIGPGDVGGGTGGTGGGGIGTGVIAGTMPDPSTYIVPSTANYGTDPRFANLAPTYKVSKAAMPIFNRFDPAPSIPIVPVEEEEEETSLLAQGGIVGLAGGGTPKGQGITPDFMVDTYYPSLIPKALDGNKAARDALLEAHSNFDNFTLPEELLLRIKYSSFRHGGVAERGYSHDGIGTLNATARNMFRPMVS